MTDLPNFSASRINLYRTCARMYRYQYVDEVPGNTHAYTVMGSALHSAIENYYLHEKNPAGTFSARFNEGVGQAMDRAQLVGTHLVSKAAVLGQEILANIKWWEIRPTDIEVGFSLPFPTKNPRVLMRGFIDMITEEEWVIDHKSTSKKPTKAALAVNPQLIIYCWAYREVRGHLPTAVYWHHLRTQEMLEAEVLVDFEDKLRNLEEELVRILEDREYPKIERGYFCNTLCAHTDRCWPQHDYGNTLIDEGAIARLWK